VRFVGLRLASGLLMALAVGSGCRQDEHVGRPCDLGANVTNGSSGQIVVISQAATECPSGICIGPVDPGQGTGGLCTASCGSNDECSDGEIANANDPADTRCKTGFACMWPTTVGTLQCERLCVCRDLVGDPQGGFQKPAVCP